MSARPLSVPSLTFPYLRLMRPRQWIKNGFVMAPVLFAGAFLDGTALARAFLATAAFCLAASLVYVANDLVDLESDRLHPDKRHTRPLAEGSATVRGARLLFALLALALVVAVAFIPTVGGPLAAYVALNLAYTLRLKRVPVVDLFCVASGFVLRVAAGALAVRVPLSGWMLITTLCLALYLAAVKRRQELAGGGDARAVLGS